MTPKNKALQLFSDFHVYDWDEELGYLPDERESKRMAIRCVDEILNELPDGYMGNFAEERKQYWKDVKTEIENL